MEQRSPEWFAARLGKVTASRVADVVARTKSGPAASRKNYMAELIAERLTGVKTDTYVNATMQWGTDMEPEARGAYEFYRDVAVIEAPFIAHPTIGETGASPDGLVGDDGLLELKCPSTATHLDTLAGAEIEGKYIIQMQWQMACTGRRWCDFASFDPRLPESMRLHVRRVARDDKHIAELEREVLLFLTELRNKLYSLRAKYQPDNEPLPEAARILMAG